MNEATDLVYGLEDRPPLAVVLASAFQIVAVISLQALNALLVGEAAGLSADALGDMLRASFLALAIGTLLQAQRWGRRVRIGSGFLAPSSMSAVFIPRHCWRPISAACRWSAAWRCCPASC